MTKYGHLLRILVLMSLVITGVLLTAGASAILLLFSGVPMNDLAEMSRDGMQSLSPAMMRMLLLAQHLLVFILPGLLFAYLLLQPGIFSKLDLAVKPASLTLVFGILFLMAAYPLVNLSFLVNEQIPLPSWALDLEDQAAETIRLILQMDNAWVFVANLVIIAILPGIGEELIFRGIIQKEIGSWLKSPIASIWISGLIFSFIHMQFEGLLPRMVLGVVLGYLYHWTQNLWIPMIAHAFNNGLQVALIYFAGVDISEIDKQSAGRLEWWMFPLSIGAMYVLYTFLIKPVMKRDTA